MAIFVKASDVPSVLAYLLRSSPNVEGPLDFGHQDPGPNKKLYEDFNKLPPFKAPGFSGLTDNGNKLVLNNTNDTFALVDSNNQRVHYLMEYYMHPTKIKGVQCVSQVEIWNTDDENFKDSVNGVYITAFVFNLLVSTYDAVMTDQNQSPDGQAFWKKMVTSAFAKGGRYVYELYFERPGVTNINLISSVGQFNTLTKSLWGNGERYLKTRVAIAKNKVW